MQHLNLNRPTRALMLLAVGTIVAVNFAPQVSQASASLTAPKPTQAKQRKPRRPPVKPVAIAPSSPAPAATNSLEQAAHDQVNQYRASKNLSPLKWNDAIAAQARQHSANMASGQTAFGHDGFQGRVQGTGLDYQGAAENVAFNQGYSDPVGEAVKGWLASPGHLKNIEGNYDTAGIGVTQNAQGEIYFTQLFIRSR
jgi:uncharacterized protein YkwD